MIDTRDTIKEESELIHDRALIVEALSSIKGYKYYSYSNNNIVQTNRPKNVVKLAHVNVIDAGMEDTGITFHKRANVFTRPSNKHYYAMIYGDVVYLRENLKLESSILYVWVKGNLVLQEKFEHIIDIWKFSLYYQDAIKNHEEIAFRKKLKKDKYFWTKY